MLSVIVSCKKEELEEITEDFGIVEGFLTTGEGDNPLVGFPLFVVSPSGIVGQTFTDPSGFYQIQFKIKEDETNPFSLVLGSHDVTGFEYCRGISVEFLLFQPQINETTVLDNIFVPRAAQLVPRAVNSDQFGEDDTLSFEVTWDGKSVYFDTCEKSTDFPFDQSSSQSDTIQVAANIPLLLRTTSVKNGVRSETTETITLQTGEIIDYDVVFE